MKKVISIYCTVLFLLSCFSIPSVAQDNTVYIGVWRGKKANQLIIPNKSYQKARDIASQKGYTHLYKIEASESSRSILTVWEKKSGSTTTMFTGTWEEIQAKMSSLAKGSNPRKLKNIKTFTDYTFSHYNENNSKVLKPSIKYHAVFEEGNKKQVLFKSNSWDGFVKGWKNISKKNMRLVKVDYHYGKKRPYFVGLFEAGTQGYYLYNLQGWDNFAKKWEELGKKNYRLVDIETYKINGKRYYIGAWLYGKDGYYLWNVKGYKNFKKKFSELNGKMELVDLERYN